MNSLKSSFQKLLFYPSALVGMLVVLLLVFTAIYAMVKIPYREAIRLWRGGEEVVSKPEICPPAGSTCFQQEILGIVCRPHQ
jgi:peptide/nickel transport system permease protein